MLDVDLNDRSLVRAVTPVETPANEARIEAVRERAPQPRRRPQRRRRAEAQDRFDKLARAAERAHEQLNRENSRYRFCVYREGDQVRIDVVRLDDGGAIIETVQKDITHEEFQQYLAHIETRQGLFLDIRA